MATLICSHCSQIVSVDDGPVPDQCPFCGGTLQIGKDSTRTGGPQPALPSTVIQAREDQPSAIGRYVVQSKLGGGGFGSVFLAKDLQLDRLVAIKVPRPDTGMTPHALERFAREGRNAAQLRHEGIVPIFNVEHDGEVPFLVCEYVEGETLSDLLRKGPVSCREAARLVAETATATHHAHEQGIIHRDIKPSNIMIAPDGKPRLMDFGMAKRDEVDPSITVPHAILGTPAYMSPEQAWGSKRRGVDRRSDVYSLGTVLYHLLTREIPFHGEARMVLRQVIQDEPKNPRSLNGEIPLDLETICQKAMQKEPSARYQTAAALSDDLNRWLRGEPIQARPVTRFERSWRWCRRNPAPTITIATVALFLVALAGGGGLFAAVEANARKKAEDLLTENRAMLSKSYVERASRHLRPDGDNEPYSVIKALPWFYAALQLDEQNPLRRDASRLRLGAALSAAPVVEKLLSHGGSISVAALSPNGDRFFTGGSDGTGRLWVVNKQEPLKPDLVHPSSVRSAQFSPDGKLLLTGCEDGAARLWDVASGQLVGEPLRDQESARERWTGRRIPIGLFFASFSPSGRYVVTASNGTIQTWETATGKRIGSKFAYPAPRVASAEFTNDEKTLLIAGNNGSVIRLNVETGKVQRQLAPAAAPGNSLPPPAISPDDSLIATMNSAKSVVLRNGETGEGLNVAELIHESAVTVLCFATDGHTLASGTKDGTVCLWSTADGKRIWKRRLSAGEVQTIEFGRQGEPLLVSTTGIFGVYNLDVESGDFVADPIILPRAISLSRKVPQSETVATATTDGVVRFWKMEGDDPVLVLPHSARVYQAAVSANRRVVATIDKADVCCMLTAGFDGPRAFRRWNEACHRRHQVQTGNVRHSREAEAIGADGNKRPLCDGVLV